MPTASDDDQVAENQTQPDSSVQLNQSSVTQQPSSYVQEPAQKASLPPINETTECISPIELESIPPMQQ